MSTFWSQDSAELFRPPGNYRDYTMLAGPHLQGRVLDVGCNRAWLAGLTGDYFGIEPNAAAVEAARRHWGASLKLSAEEIASRIQVGRGEELPFGSASFDFVFAKDVLEHSREPERVMGEIARVLKPGGAVYLSTPDAQPWVWNDPTHWRPYPRGAHRALANSFGFRVRAEAYESVMPGTQHIARRWEGRSPFFVRWIAKQGLCSRNVISLLEKI